MPARREQPKTEVIVRRVPWDELPVSQQVALRKVAARLAAFALAEIEREQVTGDEHGDNRQDAQPQQLESALPADFQHATNNTDRASAADDNAGNQAAQAARAA